MSAIANTFEALETNVIFAESRFRNLNVIENLPKAEREQLFDTKLAIEAYRHGFGEMAAALIGGLTTTQFAEALQEELVIPHEYFNEEGLKYLAVLRKKFYESHRDVIDRKIARYYEIPDVTSAVADYCSGFGLKMAAEKNGLTSAELSYELTKRSVKRHLQPRQTLPDSAVQNIIDNYIAGHSLVEISKMCSVRYGTVRLYLLRAGLLQVKRRKG